MNFLLRTTDIEKCTGVIFLIERKIVPEHLAPVALLGTGTEGHVTMIFSKEVRKVEGTERAATQVAKFIIIPDGIESLVVVEASKCGLMTHE